MSKHNYKKSRLKYVFLAFTCATAFAFSGIASACGNNEPEEETDKTKKEDTQLLKNGNFEFFTIPETQKGGNDPIYLIKTPENWSHGGTTSYTMSGILSTSETAWEKINADTLADDLDINNKLDSSAANYLEEYIDYNGMKSSDILYKDQYEALKSEDDYKEDEVIPENRKDKIENPGTHYNVHKKDGALYATVDGKEVPVYTDEDGEYFLEYDEETGEYGKPISNVLMVHNYATSHNGIAQHYSSVEVELPSNTAAEISVWVKTSYLKFSKGKDVTQDRGANITVTQTVGSSTLDNFEISCINTEKLLAEGKIDDTYNGWVEYTIYVNACDFATTKIKIELGLGDTGYTTEGYAFFDDVSVTKYVSLDKSESFAQNEDKLSTTTCTISTDKSEKVYKVDSYKRNDNPVDARYSNNFHYLIDLASEQSEGSDNAYSPINFGTVKHLSVGYTVDDDNYVSSKSDIGKVPSLGFNGNNIKAVDDAWRLPFKTGLTTNEDFLAYTSTNHTFTASETSYYEKLNKALSGAAGLPKNPDNNVNNMLVMLSAYGAAYTSSFDLSIKREGYQIISFWVKTSDMNGNTAATLSITQKGNDENTASFTVDTTGIVTDIGDTDSEKDIYDGWVQCFFFVHNELEKDGNKDADTFTVKFNFGNTTIKGTQVQSYTPGWVALANMQRLNVDEDIFSYTGSGDYTASLTISEEAEKFTQAFDEAYANQSHEIKNDLVNASSFKGVNGGSSAIVNNGHVSIPFDEFNNNVDKNGNKFTGLLNKEYFVDGNYSDKSWYNTLLDNFNASGLDALTAWNQIFGTKSVQPLIINSTTRTSYVEEQTPNEKNFGSYYVKKDGVFVRASTLENAKFDANETYYTLTEVINYGYIGSDSKVSAESYSTISVRVKASANATAYVYLVDTSAGKNLLSFGAPSYSFYYDVDGNVLKEEPQKDWTLAEQRDNILYTLRDDGLYEDKNGNLYANLWNYSKLYYANIDYYDLSGKKYSIDDLVDGVTYYDSADETTRKEADHYLVTGSGIKVYQCLNGVYHYIVEGKTQSETVNKFDSQYARYDFSNVSEDYMVKIVGKDHLDGNGNPEWVTVTFVIHAGNEEKSYRLELWSGKRDSRKQGSTATNDATVIFDYSYTSVSDDSAKNEYEQEIINAYLNEFAAHGKLDKLSGIDTTGKNIAYFEKLAKENDISIDTQYKAHYYTFSLYDSADFLPFNKEVASDGATGYDYSVTDQSETLAYLWINDTERNEYNVFVDYSVIDKSISLNNPTDNDTDDKDEDKENDGSIWLLASSIILVIALVFAIIAIFLRDALKKVRRNKVTSKNNYDQRKTNRYKRKLHLKQEEIVEVDADATEAPEAEAVEDNGEVPEITEDLVEETSEDIEAPEEVEEAPAESPADDDGKQE